MIAYVDAPDLIDYFYSESDEMEYAVFEPVADIEDGTVIRDPDGVGMQDASLSLLSLVDKYVDDEMKYFSINHEFSKTWQLHEYSYDELVENMNIGHDAMVKT